MKIAFQNFYEDLTRDGYLFKNLNTINGQDALKGWCDFYQRAPKLGWECLTLDQVPDLNELSACVFLDRPRGDNERANAVLANSNIVKILVIYESPMIKPDNWDIEYHKKFSRIFTWSDDLVDGRFYVKSNLTSDRGLKNSFEPLLVGHDQRKLACMINTRILPPAGWHKQELYTQRLTAIRWFEANHPEDFDLWGNHWSRDVFPSYQGRSEDKYKTYANYKFAICFENAYGYNGYITEKILDCLVSGIVPVYWGAPNISSWIPSDCYVDIRNFGSYPELYSFLRGIQKDRYAMYLDAIRGFLCSSESFAFSDQCFFSTLLDFVNFELSDRFPDSLPTVEGKILGVTAKTHVLFQNKKALDLTVLPKDGLACKNPLTSLFSCSENPPRGLAFDPAKLIVAAGYGDELPVFQRARGVWEFVRKMNPAVEIVFVYDSIELPYAAMQAEHGDIQFGIGPAMSGQVGKVYSGLDSSGYASGGVWSSHENNRGATRLIALWRFLLERYDQWEFLYCPTITSVVNFAGLFELLSILPTEGVYAGLPGTLRHPPYQGVGMVHGANTLLSRDVVETLVSRAKVGHTNAAQPSDHWLGLLLPDVPRTALPLFSFESARQGNAQIEECYKVAGAMLQIGHFHFRVKTRLESNGSDLYRRENVDPRIMFRVVEAIADHQQGNESVITLAERVRLACSDQAPGRNFPLDDMEYCLLYK
jgi:hypothetical protein